MWSVTLPWGEVTAWLTSLNMASHGSNCTYSDSKR